jgi:RNA polymerase sigma factor (sigma-70 family)
VGRVPTKPIIPLTAAQRQQVEENRKLAYVVVNKTLRHYRDLTRLAPDLEQFALEEMCLSTQTYDRRLGPFSTYAYVRMTNRVQREIGAGQGAVRHPRTWKDAHGNKRNGIPPMNWASQVDVYHEALGLAGDAGISPEAVRGEYATKVAEEAWDAIFDRLVKTTCKNPARDTDVFVRVRVQGQTRREAAEAWGLSCTRVDQILFQMKPHFDAWAAEVRGEDAVPERQAA